MGTQTAEQKSTSTVSSTTKAISDTARQAMAYNAVIQAYISALKGTPDIDLSSITFPDADKHVIVDLPKHQQLARKNADFYKDGPTSPNAQVASTLSAYNVKMACSATLPCYRRRKTSSILEHLIPFTFT